MRSHRAIFPTGVGPRTRGGRTCPVCKSTYYPTSDWGCHYGETQVCSIPCMKKLADDAKKSRLERFRRTQGYQAWKMDQQGVPQKEIGRLMGKTRQQVASLVLMVEINHAEDARRLLREETA